MQGKKIAATVILGIGIIKFVPAAIECIKNHLQITNPLIPDALYEGIRNYSLFVAGCYFVTSGLNLFYLYVRKFFWLIIVISSLILIGLSVFTVQISDFFINAAHF